MRPLISVVIPAHNPGRYIEPCIRSLLRQTLARTEFEVVFVDDGSTDGTGKRLDRLAREQPHVRVIHIPASGGPGRPRNVGLEAALGEYVQFLDADDELAPRALERLLRMARANRSDIVLGKFASETMTRRQDLFTRNRGATTPKTDFGNPAIGTSYQVCVYDGTTLRMSLPLPAGGACAGRPCWKENGSGFQYSDKSNLRGVSRLTLKSGAVPGKAKILLKGRGENLAMPPLPIAEPVTVQIRNSAGVCWDAVFSAPSIRNQADQYKDKSD